MIGNGIGIDCVMRCRRIDLRDWGGHSLILFPEGTRGVDENIGRFSSGIYNLAQRFPQAELVPVYLDNPRRVMPKGSFLIVPLICTARFAVPLTPDPSEDREEFLARARSARVALADPQRSPEAVPRTNEMMANTVFVAVTGGVIAFLALCTLIGFMLAHRVSSPAARDTVANLNARVRSSWGIVVVFGAALVFEPPRHPRCSSRSFLSLVFANS
jgi:hypothetical protein